MHVAASGGETLPQFAMRVYPFILEADFLRYFIGAGLTFVGVEYVLAFWTKRRQIRDSRPPVRQMLREFLASMRTVAIFSSVGLLIAIGVKTQALHLAPSPVDAAGWAWFAVNIGLFLLAHDAWFYWTHRLLHRPALFRRFHRLHHRSNNPSPFAAYAFDAGEAMVNAAFYPAFLFLVPTSLECALAFVVVMMTLNAIGHCGHELYPAGRDGDPLFPFLTTVTHHDLHHANARWNFGLYFTHWDRWMGTEHPRYRVAFRRTVRRACPLRAAA